MTTKKGTISVNTTDILPIIKKWLYSEHDIFLRELVSNACDAITKRTSLARTAGVEMPTGKVDVAIDKKAKTITITDNGLGMTEAEVEKYIAQLAFSGAEEFVKNMKEDETTKDDIIGRFGLGFYSSFMVADKVEINSLSMNKDAKPTKWTCDGDTDYEFSDSDRTEVGTEIILHINKESEDFLNSYKTRETLTRYCDFMPFQIELKDLNENDKIAAENLKVEKEEDKKTITADIINETTPLWKKDPSTLTNEDYKGFYKKLYPMDADPLFWLHLNVDHPFTLQGILYFPKLNPNKPMNENNIKLYSKQVFVSDNVKDVIPEFLGLLKGAIDSVDIPLNVSRSSLQGDPNIKKISNYIIKKVAESLKKLHKNEREKYEKSWEDIGLFIKYGVISDTKFDDQMRERVLFKNSDSKLVTLNEYKESIPADYKEKVGDKVIYFEEGASNVALREQLKSEGIQAITTDNYIDSHFMQHVEMQKKGDNEFKFTVIDNAIEEILETQNATEDDIKIQDAFKSILVGEKKDDDPAQMEIEVRNFKNAKSAAYFKVDEQMKRFQKMTAQMGQSSFSMPIKKTLVLNTENNLVKNAFKIWNKGENKDLATKICHHIQDLASISGEGLDDKEREIFVNRSQDLVSELSNLAL
jgi:molecular chaperone HtpG